MILAVLVQNKVQHINHRFAKEDELIVYRLNKNTLDKQLFSLCKVMAYCHEQTWISRARQ